jgi:hypothetical protein
MSFPPGQFEKHEARLAPPVLAGRRAPYQDIVRGSLGKEPLAALAAPPCGRIFRHSIFCSVFGAE